MMSGSKGQNPIVLAQRGLRELRSNEAIRDISKGQNLLLTLSS